MKERSEFPAYFRQIQLTFSRFYARVLVEARLTFPQYALLNLLAARGTLSMTEISRGLHISKPAVTNLVDRLEKSRCLKRLAHPRDRRVFLLKIQPRGEKIVRQIQTHILSLLMKTLAEFDAAEQRTIMKFYGRLAETLTGALATIKGEKK